MIKESFTEYRSRRLLNASRLKIALSSAIEFELSGMDGYIAKPKSAAMSLGDAAHCFILEPDKFDGIFAVKPEGFDGRSKEGRDWNKENGHKSIISHEDFLFCQAMRWRIENHPVARQFLPEYGASTEVTILGSVCDWSSKARFDMITPEGVIGDLKTTRAETPEEFVRDALIYHYDLSAHFYRIIQNEDSLPDFFFVVLSTSRWQVWVIRLLDLPELVQSGSMKLYSAFENINRMMEAKALKNPYGLVDKPIIDTRARWELEKY